MKRLHALLVGINTYPVETGVTGLDGCVNDVMIMEAFIRLNYQGLHPLISLLKNEEATRLNLIDSFRSNLTKKAKAGDTVLFYYSGHGSYNPTSTIFKKFDPKAQDETLVCYDSRLPGGYDLADKEIAVLLSEIPAGVHVVVVADSCHAATISRSGTPVPPYYKKRFTSKPADMMERPIESYLDGPGNFYHEQVISEKPITIPKSKHLVIAACGRHEEALETMEQRGLFSTMIMDALKENKSISYARLFSKIRHGLSRYPDPQTPVLHTHEGFNPNTIFLRGEEESAVSRYPVRYINKRWRIPFGAIHGLPVDHNGEIEIGIYKETDQKTLVTNATIQKVCLKESLLTITDDLNPRQMYSGKIQSFSMPLLIGLKGETSNIAKLESIYKTMSSPFLAIDPTAINAPYFLSIESDGLKIYNAENELIHGCKSVDEIGVRYIVKILEQIEGWERIAGLKNPQTKISGDIEITFVDKKQDEEPIEHHDTGSITLNFPKSADDPHNEYGNPFEIKVRNIGQRPYYIALLFLDASYQISTFYNCQLLGADKKWYTIDDERSLFIDQLEWNEVTDIFQLLVSTEPFDDYTFQQTGFSRGEIKEDLLLIRGAKAARKRTESDWCTKTITVNSIRKESLVGAQDVVLEGGSILIKEHSSFRGEISFAPIQSGARSVHPQAALAKLFRGGEYGILNLSEKKTRGFSEKSIIRIDEISQEGEVALRKEPLVLELKGKVSAKENLIPVTYHDGFVIPFGHSWQKEDGTTVVTIDQIPEVPDVHRKRSIKKALWFCLLKVTGFRSKAFRLRVAELDQQDKLIRTDEEIKTKVAKAKKVALLVHGIIGDTKDMAKQLQFLKSEYGYDIILTFDYENLNEPIEKTAEELLYQLSNVGLHAADGKQLDIISHSMGGLVSRYLIEVLQKDQPLVDRLFMFGTPNGGSNFGSIPEMIRVFNSLMLVAANFNPPAMGSLLTILNILEKANSVLGVASPTILVTLDQMSEMSDLVKKLKTNQPPSVTYYIIAGDSTLYKTAADSIFNQFIEKVLLKVGDVVNCRVPNDIAVNCEQIMDVPDHFKVTKKTVAGHHLNYFINPRAMEVLRDILVNDRVEKSIAFSKKEK